MTETRWRGLSHKELYLLLHDGPGPAAAAEPSRRWGAVAAALTEIGEDLHKALDGADWAGRAAGAAYDRLSTTAGWAARTATSAAEMRASVESQAEHIATARAEMPKPEDVPTTQPDPTVAPAIQVAALQTDLETPEAAAASGEERAFEVMAAYELNSTTTTAALATFSTPTGLVEVTTVHDRGGAMQIPATEAAALHGPHGIDRPGSEHGRGWHSPGTPGAAAPGTSGAPAPGTSGAAAPAGAEVTRRPLPTPASPPPAPAPGNLSGATAGPFLAPNAGRPGGSGRRGSSDRASASRSGATSLGSSQVNDLQQAAAASQAAANSTAHPGAAPFAPTAGAPAGGQDKVALRRFGMDAIGSSQWFGDEPVVGHNKRRRDFRETEQEVTESVSVLGEEHKLPPNVIGER